MTAILSQYLNFNAMVVQQLADRPILSFLCSKCRLSQNHFVTKSLCDKIAGNPLTLMLILTQTQNLSQAQALINKIRVA